MTKRGKYRRVWVGFSDNKPHVDKMAEKDRQPGYAIFSTKKAAKECYEDVRAALLVWEDFK